MRAPFNQADGPGLRTARLLLRPWKESDLVPFAELNADPQVMRFFPKSLTKTESDGFAARIQDHFTAHGYGLWAVEIIDGSSFIGFVGLSHATFEASFNPSVEVGWRLAQPYWGNGYATEGALAALEYGFNEVNLAEIMAFTAEINVPSWRVMKRLHMIRKADFDHPALPIGHPLRPHVHYASTRHQWSAR